MTSETPTTLELRALREALSGPELWKNVLTQQIDHLLVVARTDTIVGGYTDFELTGSFPTAQISAPQGGYPATIDIIHPDLAHGGAYIVWTEDGCISQLEYYTNADERWPDVGDNSLELFKFVRPKL